MKVIYIGGCKRHDEYFTKNKVYDVFNLISTFSGVDSIEIMVNGHTTTCTKKYFILLDEWRESRLNKLLE